MMAMELESTPTLYFRANSTILQSIPTTLLSVPYAFRTVGSEVCSQLRMNFRIKKFMRIALLFQTILCVLKCNYVPR